jgi:ABC-2 type transport system ATP-binding protein
LACALVGRPRLAILDEPSSGLDPGTRREIWELIEQLRSTGTTVALSTHSLEEAERLSDWIVIVDRGRCVASGTTADLTGDPDGQTLRFRAAAHLDRSALLRALPPGFELVEESAGRYRLSGADIAPATIAAVTAWCAERGVLAEELSISQRNLEQVFLDVTTPTRQAAT